MGYPSDFQADAAWEYKDYLQWMIEWVPRPRKKKAIVDDEEEEEELEPNIFILSSGEISPFVMEMYVKDNSEVMAKISANEAGKVWIGDEDEEDEDSF